MNTPKFQLAHHRMCGEESICPGDWPAFDVEQIAKSGGWKNFHLQLTERNRNPLTMDRLVFLKCGFQPTLITILWIGPSSTVAQP